MTKHTKKIKAFFNFKICLPLVIVRGHLGGKVHSSAGRCRTARVPQCLRWREWWALVARSQTQDSARWPLRGSHLRHTERREKAGENPQRSAGQKQSGWFPRITFRKRKNLLRRDKLVKSVFFIWELNWKEKKRVLSLSSTKNCTNLWNVQKSKPVVKV